MELKSVQYSAALAVLGQWREHVKRSCTYSMVGIQQAPENGVDALPHSTSF